RGTAGLRLPGSLRMRHSLWVGLVAGVNGLWFSPAGILMPKLVSVKEQPIPKIRSASARNFGTARGTANPPEPSDRGCVSGNDDLPPRLVVTGIASRSASFFSCGHAFA